MPHYNWRRSRPNSSSDSSIVNSISRQVSRSSAESSEISGGGGRSPSPPKRSTPSPPSSVDYSHLQIEPLSLTKSTNNGVQQPNSKILSKTTATESKRGGNSLSASPTTTTISPPTTSCPTCGLAFDEAIIARQPRLMPCLHSFCTQCLQNVYDHLETLHVSRINKSATSRISRYSWRGKHQQNSCGTGSGSNSNSSRSNSSSPQSVKSILGHFMCPFCHNMALIYNGGREAILCSFPIDQLVLSIISTEQSSSSSSLNKSKSAANKSLLDLVVQEIHPKIKVIQKAVFDTEMAKTKIKETVSLIEQRLMPKIPSESEALTKVRNDLMEKLEASKLKRLNIIIRKQLVLKQCEKDLKFLYGILEKMNTLTTTSDAKSIHASIFPHLAKRLSDLGNLLDSVSTKISPGSEASDENISAEVFEAEIISQTTVPAKILAELSKPLYEKVVCDIPFLVLDSTKKLVARQDALSKLSGGLVFKKDDLVKGTFKGSDYLGSIHMEVIPPQSGLAEIDLKFEDQSVPVRPSTAFIRPLSLDSMKRLSTGSNKSIQSAIVI